MCLQRCHLFWWVSGLCFAALLFWVYLFVKHVSLARKKIPAALPARGREGGEAWGDPGSLWEQLHHLLAARDAVGALYPILPRFRAELLMELSSRRFALRLFLKKKNKIGRYSGLELLSCCRVSGWWGCEGCSDLGKQGWNTVMEGGEKRNMKELRAW